MVLLWTTACTSALLHIPHVAMTDGVMWDIASPVIPVL